MTIVPDNEILQCLAAAGSGGTRLVDLIGHLVHDKGTISCPDDLINSLRHLGENGFVIAHNDRYYLPHRVPKKN